MGALESDGDWSRRGWLRTSDVLVSDRAELSNLIKEVLTLRLDDGGLLDLYPILDGCFSSEILGDDNAWHAGAHLEVVGHFDLWELLEAGPVVRGYYYFPVTVDHQLNRVTAG